MRKILAVLFFIAIIFSFTGKAEAIILTFDTSTMPPGISLGGQMTWHGTGGGHLYCESYNNHDWISFSSPTYIHEYQMNAMPWQGYNGGTIGSIFMAAFDPGNNQVWSGSADLRNYTSWDNWLTVPVDRGNINLLMFYAPGGSPYYNGFWPSVDNMRINENNGNGHVVPEPATMALFGAGLLGAGMIRRKKR